MGRVEIRQIFKLTKAGQVAGCFVAKGKINRAAQVEVVRNGQPVFEGKLGSLKRFKDDVREVAEGFECGLTVAGFDGIMVGDIVEEGMRAQGQGSDFKKVIFIKKEGRIEIS